MFAPIGGWLVSRRAAKIPPLGKIVANRDRDIGNNEMSQSLFDFG